MQKAINNEKNRSNSKYKAKSQNIVQSTIAALPPTKIYNKNLEISLRVEENLNITNC